MTGLIAPDHANLGEVMARLGWFLIVAGLVIAATFCALDFALPTPSNDLGKALFVIAGFAGLIVAAVGIVYLNRARGRWAPPL